MESKNNNLKKKRMNEVIKNLIYSCVILPFIVNLGLISFFEVNKFTSIGISIIMAIFLFIILEKSKNNNSQEQKKIGTPPLSSDFAPAGTLKTLKDIDSWALQGFVTKRDLKAEVIKWVKEMRKFNELDINEIWFMKFFNLTEEDLLE